MIQGASKKKVAKTTRQEESGRKKSVVAANESGMYWRWSLNWILRKTRVIVQSWCQLSFGVSRFVIQHYASKFVRMLRWIWFNQNTILSMPSPFHLISVFALSFNWLPLSFFFSVCLSLSVKINSVCLARQHADTNGTQPKKKKHIYDCNIQGVHKIFANESFRNDALHKWISFHTKTGSTTNFTYSPVAWRQPNTNTNAKTKQINDESILSLNNLHFGRVSSTSLLLLLLLRLLLLKAKMFHSDVPFVRSIDNDLYCSILYLHLYLSFVFNSIIIFAILFLINLAWHLISLAFQSSALI